MTSFRVDEEGHFAFGKEPRNWNPDYRDATLRYLNSLGPLFLQAKKASEWDLLLTLFGVRGVRSAGWNPFETTKDIFDKVTQLRRKESDQETNWVLHLWLYVHIVEASEPYEVIANLLNIVSGGSYKSANFPDKGRQARRRPWFPHEKIAELHQRADKAGQSAALLPLDEVYDRELRNSIAHSDFSIHDSELRGSKVYSSDEVHRLLNRTLAYFSSLVFLHNKFRRDYNEAVLIDVPKYFDPRGIKAQVIVRKGEGAVGVKHAWSREQLQRGHIPFQLGSFLPYELRLLEADPTLGLLPENRFDKYNRIYRRLPGFVKKRAYGLLKRLASGRAP